MLINADLLHQKVAPKGPDQRPGEDHRYQFFGGKNVLGLWSDFQMEVAVLYQIVGDSEVFPPLAFIVLSPVTNSQI